MESLIAQTVFDSKFGVPFFAILGIFLVDALSNHTLTVFQIDREFGAAHHPALAMV